MKTITTKLFLVAMLLLIAAPANAQSSTSGIAIQGIARDANNNGRFNENIKLNLKIYYMNGTTEVEIYPRSVIVTTDGVGVFSTVIQPGISKNVLIANYEAYLRISEGDVVISDEKLRQVAYAMSAGNGVPTGSIMPYIGTVAPAGWVLCDGRSLTTIEGASALIGLLGKTEAPALQAMFLRGSGQRHGRAQHLGPDLKTVQDDTYEAHSHVMNPGGNHEHNSKYPREFHGVHASHNDNYNLRYSPYNDDDATNLQNKTELFRHLPTSGGGVHNHAINPSGTAETRPVNYGVNYIIKL